MSDLKELTIEDRIKQELEKPNYTVDLSGAIVITVTDKDTLAEAEKTVKALKSLKTSFLNIIKPIKQKMDSMKAMVLSREKSESDAIDKIIAEQEKAITAYKIELKKEQDRLKAEAERIARDKAEAERLERVKQAEAEKARLEKELAEIAKNKPIAEVIDELEAKKEEIQKVETVIPEIVIEPEKVILKKDEVKTKTVYTITDEKSFIQWAIKSNRLDLLEIKISKSGFNSFCKTDEFKNLSLGFIESKEEVI